MLESPLLSHTAGYINGSWQRGVGEPFQVTNPANGEVLAEIPAMGAEETRQAIEAGRHALESSAGLETRRAWLQMIAEALTDNREEIGRILTHEHGKPWKEGIGEVDYAAGFFRYAGENIGLLKPYTLQEQPRGLSWTVYHRPAGVVGLMTPWNFPIGMIAKKLSAALAADCSCVVKPSRKTPLTMIALFDLLDRTLDLPPGKVNLVMGGACPITDTLMEHPHVRVISFTGSTAVGRQLIRKSADGIKRLTLELGGNAPFIVFADADLDHAAEQLVSNKFRGGGQTCVCSNRIFVERPVAPEFAEKLAEKASALRVGNGMDRVTDIGPLIDRSGYEKVRSHLTDALDKGAQMVSGGDPGEWSTARGFFRPTVIRGVAPGMLVTREETFGPLVPIAEFDSEEEVIARANDTEFGLAAYLFTADPERAGHVVSRLEFAHVGWNTGSGPTPEAPFGGMKQSGFGREGGREGLVEFVETQTVAQQP
ncbi:NAD-dependent succinate-semialdehyde dehydrogenase [Thiohalomonas denitrificans]|uniref:Succinate-semialdehyde dehydrogenase / glutarate-semialdehyde dehydrogenase n=1 Tax=Thiohalomonas denitrificans TaxID=415747 RepID=A0A1G5PW91_9GAMM|nr:NAD-dependent succinate-semialdehyde dehydrogenase [Thiohalomonas denitrificans]SCZ53520.1 succinate-semialdehyde dehydrogenase / glutarate-semialdehyde dehydrogenase [Thiohalomonas denitrificans]